MDEHAQSTIVQIVNKFFLLVEYFGDNMSREHILPALSVMATIVFIIVVGYVLAHLVRMEEQDIQKQQSLKTNNNGNHLLRPNRSDRNLISALVLPDFFAPISVASRHTKAICARATAARVARRKV